MSASTPKGPDAPVWTRRGDDSAKSWGRDREQGAAFRGISRGRGRGGGSVRGKLGGRGTGGRSISTRDEPILKSDPPPLPGPGKAGAGGGPVTNNSAPSKGREISKIPSRPNLSVSGSIAQASDSISPLSPSKPTRRRRNTNKRSASAAVPKPIPITLTDGLPASPSNPLMPPLKGPTDPIARIEDATNLNASVPEIRQDITSLVEHVRSMAMDSKRPNSPTTHLDWAGDDDDSLPDLDDWGVSSKLASDVGETSTNISSKPNLSAETGHDPTLAPIHSISETAELEAQAISQPVALDGAQSSAESPTESSMSMTMSLSTPPPVKRVRERRRGGSRKDKDKKAQLTLSSNGSKEMHALATSNTAPKKSLLERLSPPIICESPALPRVPGRVSSGVKQAINKSTSDPTLLRHAAPLPKQSNVPNKPPSSNNALESWRNNRTGGSPAKVLDSPVLNTESVVGTVAQETPKASENMTVVSPSVELKDNTVTTVKQSSFDWSEEPVSFDTSSSLLDGPSVDIEPATPIDSTASQPPHAAIISPLRPASANASSDANASPRSRSQRPLSGDTTPASRRERSPFKTHNPRNHSAPHVGLISGTSPSGRVRPPHASRPIIDVSALAMLTRNLRQSPPPRRESPPVTRVTE